MRQSCLAAAGGTRERGSVPLGKEKREGKDTSASDALTSVTLVTGRGVGDETGPPQLVDGRYREAGGEVVTW